MKKMDEGLEEVIYIRSSDIVKYFLKFIEKYQVKTVFGTYQTKVNPIQCLRGCGEMGTLIYSCWECEMIHSFLEGVQKYF